MNTQLYTFKKIFDSHLEVGEGDKKESLHIRQIEIPRIQRDYAQGRETADVKKVRARFLGALKKALATNCSLTLDFVYGDVEGTALVPLDGQQRLTTLFLLHWYAVRKCSVDFEEYEFLSRFSYSVRFSARDFCKALVKNIMDVEDGCISEQLKDKAWFPMEWKNDPTIHGMLVMLDAIEREFADMDDLWKRLDLINFYFLPLKEMGLSDELYIKMNSRGKPLTDFEHFKAEFEEMIKETDEALANDFNHRMDIEWADLLFPFRGENNIIDDEFMRYFMFVGRLICYQYDLDYPNDHFDLARKLYSLDECSHAKENLLFLKNAFDCWLNVDVESYFSRLFASDKYERGKVVIYRDDVNLFKDCIDNFGEFNPNGNRKFSLSTMLLFYAVLISRLHADEVEDKQVVRRLRIVRNLIWNSEFEIRERDQQDNNQMKRLLEQTSHIMLTGELPTTDRGYNAIQREEELRKKKWLKSNLSHEEELFKLEDHRLLQGCIAIVGIDNVSNFDAFSNLFCDGFEWLLVHRALLTVDDYSQGLTNFRWQFGAKNESVWKSLFHPSKQRECFENTKKTLNTLLRSLKNLDERQVKGQLNEQIKMYLAQDDVPYDWRYYFIKYEEIAYECYDGVYYWHEENAIDIIKLRRKQFNGYNWNVFLYQLWYKYDDVADLDVSWNDSGCLRFRDVDITVYCESNQYVVNESGEEWVKKIAQVEEGIDKHDRIKQGRRLLNEIIERYGLRDE